MKIPGIVIAASASGSGKTAVTMAMMKAFKNAGKKVRACKCGPDYIDPMFHRRCWELIPRTWICIFVTGSA